jgi:hypothetical protein
MPIDRRRLADLPGHPPPDAPLICIDTETTGLATAAGTLAFLVGLARWDGDAFCQTQLLLPDHADEAAMLAEIAAWITPDAWLVSYNGRGFDWPLIEARYRLAGRAAPVHAGHLDLLPFVRRVFRHRMEDARLRTVEGELLGVSRIGDVEGWEIPRIYLDVLRGGPVEALAGVVIHNEKDVRSLGLLLAHVERGYADREARHGARVGPRRARPRLWEKRHEDALVPGRRPRLGAARSRPVRAHARGARDRAGAARRGARGLVDAAGAADVRRPAAACGMARRHGERPRRAPGTATGRRGVGHRRRVGRRGALDRRAPRRRSRSSAAPAGTLVEAAEAWQAAAAVGGIGVIAWIEVAGCASTGSRTRPAPSPRRARRLALLDRLRSMGRAHPRLEADLLRRGARLTGRLRRQGPEPAAG